MKIKAYVNHGRWVADCPKCNGAELIHAKDVLFKCQLCKAEAECKQPRNARKIDALLEPRPLENRNWQAGESLDDLRRENAAHNTEV